MATRLSHFYDPGQLYLVVALMPLITDVSKDFHQLRQISDVIADKKKRHMAAFTARLLYIFRIP